jgi:class 2 POU domain transcription factor
MKPPLPTTLDTLLIMFFLRICRRQKEKRINPPSAAMGSPTICSVAGPNPSSMFASIANSLAGGSLSGIGNPISLVTTSAHSFAGAGGPPSAPQAPVVKSE